MNEDLFSLTEDQISDSRVVVVDDDPLVTNSLRNFLSLELEIEPVTFNEPVEARQYIDKNEIDLMKSIKRMMDPGNILNPGKLFDL